MTHTCCMKIRKESRSHTQNSLPQKNNHIWSEQDCKALAAFFAILLEMEIDQQSNVSKEYSDAK